MIEDQDPARAIAASRADGVNVYAVGPAVYRVQARIAGALRDLVGVDDLHDLRLARIGLGIDDMDGGRAQSRDYKVATLDMGMRRIGTQGRAAGVPAEVMQFIAGLRHGHPADQLAVGL